MILREENDGWRLATQDAVVQLIQIDFRLGLFLSETGAKAQLYIETPCRLKGPNVNVMLVPEQTESLAPILSLFSAKVLKLDIGSTGHLRLEFDRDYTLEVEPHDKYEAWQLGSSSGFLLVCQPGGTVAVFLDKTTKI